VLDHLLSSSRQIQSSEEVLAHVYQIVSCYMDISPVLIDVIVSFTRH
jgi:hypothetical protein